MTSDELTTWRQSQPPTEKRQRPQYRLLTEAELQSLDGLGWADKLTRARVLAQTPLPRDDPEAA